MFKRPVRRIQSSVTNRGVGLAISLCAWLAYGVAASAGDGGVQAGMAEKALKISVNFTDKETITPGEQIELRLNRPLERGEGTPAIIIGQTDVTDLYTLTGQTLRYSHKAPPLPAGDTKLTVYLVTSNENWKEVATFRLHVKSREGEQVQTIVRPQENAKPGRYGFEKFEIKPALTLNIKSQSTLLYFPHSNRPDRINFVDLSLQGSLQVNIARAGFQSQSQFDFVGTTFQKETLRYGEKGDAAPHLDLSSYQTQIHRDKFKVTVGHNSYGTNRYLINNFSSRGITVAAPLNSQIDFSASVMNGTSVVGWDNFFGVQRQKHRIVTGTFGYEFLPKRPGGFRFEASLLRGSRLPINNINESSLTDREQSSGAGAGVVMSDKAGRFQLDAGYARSRFNNPVDPQLDRNSSVVPVRETTREARYLDLSYQLLRDFSLTKDKKANLSFAYRHNRVDPLFRSAAVFVQADRLDHQFELTAGVGGGINATLSHYRSSDNLDNIPSVLKTLTRRNAFNVSLPLVSLLGKTLDAEAYPKWLPAISYALDRTYQFAPLVPVGGGFENPNTVPDQSSANQTFNAGWQFERLRFNYHFNQSFQDNRQLRREQADLKTQLHGFALGLTPHRKFDLTFDLASERAANFETDRLDRTLRASFNLNWQTTTKSSFAANVSSVFAGDVAKSTSSRNADFDLQWAWRFGAAEKSGEKARGQFFIRYANRYTRAVDNLFSIKNLTKTQTMNAGLSFTFF